ncbi:hypothetical protein IAT38_002863 [Cryptococcus sp. DSM 104549]
MGDLQENQPEAGPSRLPLDRARAGGQDGEERKAEGEVEMMEIPSTGITFFEYRRRLFMAGLPVRTTPTTEPLPDTYLVPRQLPDPLPMPPSEPLPPTMQKLEAALEQEGAEGSRELWRAGLGDLAAKLHQGRKLQQRMRLGLTIKILIASWIQDGLWPRDPKTGLPTKAPDSPLIDGVDLFPDPQLLPPPRGDAPPRS